MPEPIARAYFRYEGARYRVTVNEKDVWVERQTPRAFNGNLCMSDVEPDHVLHGTEEWIVNALPELFAKYERQYAEGVE